MTSRSAERTGESWTEHALAVLARRRYRAGEARSAVVELLGRHGGCLTADEVAGRLREDGRQVGAASVYRALGLLTDLGLLQRAPLGDGPVRYELVRPDADHHHHLVCDRCGRTSTFEDTTLEEAIEGLAERVDYAVEAHDVTLRGACPQCAWRERGGSSRRP